MSTELLPGFWVGNKMPDSLRKDGGPGKLIPPSLARVLSSLPGVYPLDVRSTRLQLVEIKNVPGVVKCPLEGQN